MRAFLPQGLILAEKGEELGLRLGHAWQVVTVLACGRALPARKPSGLWRGLS